MIIEDLPSTTREPHLKVSLMHDSFSYRFVFFSISILLFYKLAPHSPFHSGNDCLSWAFGDLVSFYLSLRDFKNKPTNSNQLIILAHSCLVILKAQNLWLSCKNWILWIWTWVLVWFGVKFNLLNFFGNLDTMKYYKKKLYFFIF